MGAVGSAYATLCARLFMATALGAVVLSREGRRPSGLHDVSWWPAGWRMKRLVRLGTPAALQVALEVGVFAVAAALAGQISAAALAANQIALNVAGFFFMVPLGLGSAAAVRVGHAVGRNDSAGVRRAGWSAIVLTLVFATLIAALFVVSPRPLLQLFTRDPAVVSIGVTVLMVWAAIQPFDGLQAVSTGALRGLGDTRSPLACNLVFHWMIGLPAGYILCFHRKWGVVGLWVGLALSLVLIGTVLVTVWGRRSRQPADRHAVASS
jgi:MATE family, multidrug efflux pump